MADQKQLDSAREKIGEFNSIDDLFLKREELNNSPEPEVSESSDIDVSSDNSPESLMDAMESLDSESSDDEAASNMASEDSSESDLPSDASGSKQDSSNGDIEFVSIKSPEGRKKLKIDYSDKKAIKNAFIKAAGMRKFQAERDEARKLHSATSKEYEALKGDFDKLEQAFQEEGVRGVVELLGGADAWASAVDEENINREYMANLSAEEKYRLEMQKKDEQYQKQLSQERQQRESFQQQIEQERETAELRSLESKLHPAFDRYRFAGKLGDAETENLYDEAVWTKAKQRLAEYPDEVELTQAIIDKEFRTVAGQFKKHIKMQTEKQLKKTVDNKKAQTTKRAQLAAKKGLSGDTTQKKILKSLKEGNLGDALSFFKQQ